MARPQKTKKKEKKNVLQGVVHIQSTFNNTIVTSTDTQGNAIAWATAGATGCYGAKRHCFRCLAECARRESRHRRQRHFARREYG